MRAATTQHHAYVAGASPRSGSAVLLIILSLCGFAGALATRLIDPLITSIAADFATPVSVVALLSSAFACRSHTHRAIGAVRIATKSWFRNARCPGVPGRLLNVLRACREIGV